MSWETTTDQMLQPSLLESRLDDRQRLGLHLVQMLDALEALGVDFVDLLSAGGTSGKPAIFGHDLEPADGRAVGRRVRELGDDRLTRHRGRGDHLRRQV